jgi:ATP-dependent RNA helicase DbpA
MRGCFSTQLLISPSMATSPPTPAAAADSGFAALGLSPSLREVVAELGFATPTPVQARGIPLLLAGRDLIGQSSTGSGKTAAFGLAILQKLKLKERRPQALILCPTRELCAQVARELRKLGRREAGLAVLILSGGQPMKPQLAALQRGVHVVVATPGRALDHIVRGSLNLSGLATLVVDEADRMLEMGFGAEMEKILSGAPTPRQTVFFSATYPRSIEAMTKAHQQNPERLTIGDADGLRAVSRQLAYSVDDRNDDARLDTLLAILRGSPPDSAPESTIVFCNFKATVARVDSALRAAGISSASLHGNLEQRDRDFVMAKFRNRSLRVLVATDVAARGLDIEGLDLVVNFELPFQPEIYVHRIGRTGRAGKPGVAVSLVGPQDRAKVKAIEAALGGPLEHQTVSGSHKHGDEARADAAMETLYISGGRKDKLRPGDILGALTGEAGGFPGSHIGKIEIHERFSYVAIARASAARAIQVLGAGRIKGKRFKVGLPRAGRS